MARDSAITACAEPPDQRFVEYGASALSDTELLAVILRGGAKVRDGMNVSARLIREAGSLEALLSWQAEDFRRVQGIGPATARQLVAIGEAARRMAKGAVRNEKRIASAADVLLQLRPEVMGLCVEKFWLLCLNRKSRLIKLVEISSGSSTSALVCPRDVFREAVRHGAVQIIGVHNHPSGDPAPSAADLTITRQLKEVSRHLEIDFADHVIVGDQQSDPLGRGYFSFREAGLV